MSPTFKNIQSLLNSWFWLRAYNTPNNSNVSTVFLKNVKGIKEVIVPSYCCRKLFPSSERLDIIDLKNYYFLLHQYSLLEFPVSLLKKLVEIWLKAKSTLARINLKGETYHIGPGLILDKNFKPLMIATYSVSKFKERGETLYFKHSPSLHISPSLLSNAIWRKFIMKYIIPICSDSSVELAFVNFKVPLKHKETRQNIKIQIHNIDL